MSPAEKDNRLPVKILLFLGKPFYLFITYFLIFVVTSVYFIKNIFSKTKSGIVFFRPTVRIPKAVSFLLLLLLFLLSITSFALNEILVDLPSPNDLLTRNQKVSTKIYDRNGQLLFKIYKKENRTPIKLSSLPKHVIDATLAAEDAEFYSHHGFSVKGIIRAVQKFLKEEKVTGGSTITQQLIKNSLLTSEKTLERKIKEIVLAIQVEREFSKDQILEMYLNEVSYGGTAYGIQEASQLYFSKDAFSLNLYEASFLAGLPKSPSRLSPFFGNIDDAFSRQKEVLKLMEVNKFISNDERANAQNSVLNFAPNKIDIKAPHFVMYVKSLLIEMFGEEVIEQGGLDVITTLDLEMQKNAEGVVKNEVESLKNLNVGNGASLIIKPKTGEILAMVGSFDYFNGDLGSNINLTLTPRQPGSSIKVVNYSFALSRSFTAATILSDTPVTFDIPGQSPYSPKNYDGKFRGNLTLRSALAESRNVPAVKVLASHGVDQMFTTGKAMGITTWDNPSNFGLSLTLGGGEVRLIDLAQVYSVIANYGKKIPLNPVLKITNYKGKIIYENKCALNPKDCESTSIIDERVAFILTDILKDNKARTPAFGSRSLLVIPNHPEVAVKTGTSNNLRDNLAIGFNQEYLVAAWVGNNDYSPMKKVASGLTGATPIWNKIMKSLIEQEKSLDWEVPEGLVKLRICASTGTLTCEGCPVVRLEWFLKENAPKKYCSPEWFNKESPTPSPTTP